MSFKMQDTILTKIQLEHDLLIRQFEKIETSNDYFERVQLFKQVKVELVNHMDGEEHTIYPRLHHQRLSQLSDREHHEIKEYLQRLNLINFGSDNWLNVFSRLKEIVRQHSQDEERSMFEEARQAISQEELQEMAFDFEAAKKSVMSPTSFLDF